MDARALLARFRSRLTGLRSRSDQLGAAGRTGVARRFGIDARALAAFRIGLGALLLADLLLRSRDLTAFYTDAGVLPRSLLREQFPVFGRLSFHAVSGSAWLQILLFVVAGVAALALLFGYRTTLATVVSFVLLVSLHGRNPLVLNAGDSILRRLAFWSIFLPLGRRWSVDALHAGRERAAGVTASVRGRVRHSGTIRTGDGPREKSGETRRTGDGPHKTGDGPRRTGDETLGTEDGGRVVGVASAALLVQMVVVYTANAAFKLRGDSWLRGEAIQYALGLDQLTVFLGDALAQYPLALGFLGRVWLGLLVSSVLLVVLTGRPRAVLASLFVGMHFGMALTMRLGIFPVVSIVGLIPFLPPEFWDVAGRRFRESGRRFREARVGRAFDLDAHRRRIEAVLPRGPRRGLDSEIKSGAPGPLGQFRDASRTITDWTRRVQPPVVGGLLALVLVWNAATLGLVGLPESADGAVDPEEYRWDMFAPEPRTDDGWYVVPGNLSSGERRDVLHGSAVEWDRPPDLARTYPNVRWFKYLVDLRRGGNAALQRGLGDYLCERWNRTHETRVEELTTYYVEADVRLDGSAPTERVKLRHHSCPRGNESN
jgi:hypothetical protein